MSESVACGTKLQHPLSHHLPKPGVPGVCIEVPSEDATVLENCTESREHHAKGQWLLWKVLTTDDQIRNKLEAGNLSFPSREWRKEAPLEALEALEAWTVLISSEANEDHDHGHLPTEETATCEILKTRSWKNHLVIRNNHSNQWVFNTTTWSKSQIWSKVRHFTEDLQLVNPTSSCRCECRCLPQ